MKLSRYAFEQLFGIGFKVGFLIVIMSTLLMYMPLIERSVNPLLDLIGFWQAFNGNPTWARLLVTGLIFIMVACFAYLVKIMCDPLIDTLFFEDKNLKTK
jgi:hypothetical protein